MEEPTPPRTASQVWSGFPQDPRDPAHAALRASDADRERVQVVLAEAFADGRLDREEYDDRSSAALAARTLGELPPLLADLLPERTPARSSGQVALADASPAELQRRAADKFADERRHALLAFLGPTLICWVIWIPTSFGNGGFHPYWPWPVFPTVFTAANAIRVVANRREIESRELRSLEKRQLKALQARQSGGDGPAPA